jgi:hypothetical protein
MHSHIPPSSHSATSQCVQHPQQSICTGFTLQPLQLVPPAPTKQQANIHIQGATEYVRSNSYPPQPHTSPAAHNPTGQHSQWPCHSCAHVRIAYVACQRHLRQPTAQLQQWLPSIVCDEPKPTLHPCPSISVGAQVLYCTAMSCCVQSEPGVPWTSSRLLACVAKKTECQPGYASVTRHSQSHPNNALTGGPWPTLNHSPHTWRPSPHNHLAPDHAQFCQQIHTSPM